MTHADVLSKLKKLTRLTRSDNAEEAASAAAKAQEFMARHNITTAMLGDVDDERQQPTMGKDQEEGSVFQGSSLPTWKIRLGMHLAKHNGCYVYTGHRYKAYTGRSARTLEVVGTPSNQDAVRYMFGWLTGEVDRLTKRDGRGKGRTWANNFRLGVVEAIDDKMVEAQAKVEQDMVTEAETQGGETALVRVKSAIEHVQQDEVTARRLAYKNLRLRANRGTYYRPNGNARAAGREAGRSINLNGGNKRLS